ncbi:hypothetical protein [Cronobacter turicensis]|uniref:hypothetical protein n=1 Tax=Cronobacter turicensis TaxID=413502 RepID=UPI0024C2F109|nr:hypothetical protein [Cronobacter turicensis]MDK1184502.1 hypothetical protein [Cronobacter turicensis]MDK1205921.1 hypothetical protein [Cronobacter turicensis]MDK1213306.1 hypothetical protein [Cronobacter turicensis]MDK1217641.1 hypothetical protein [Cronobacter turicensis]MDK1230781.1 hypothetical protein [Cronobacter turicensis]
MTGFITTAHSQWTNRITGGIECCVAVTHDKNLHIAPLLLTRSASEALKKATRFLRVSSGGRALCLIRTSNETLFFTLLT